ncbi:hypothetical protein B5F40_04990 [Gordonibacter sp. An230]|nr:hypothetical protein B5F40_04990 [Gordonibacter sp. An230]
MHRRSGASGARSGGARSGSPFRIQGSSVTVLAAVKRFGGKKGLGEVRDLRKRAEDKQSAAEIRL